MKINAKQLTFLYFSILASAIIIIHASVFLSTAENMERLYAENRLDKISDYLLNSLNKGAVKAQPEFLLQTQGNAKFDPFIQVYFDYSKIPSELNIAEDLAIGTAYEVEDIKNKKTYFVLKQNLGPKFGIAHLVLDNSFYELIEESLPTSHTRQLFISLALLIISLFIILKMSARLSQPISQVAKDLSARPAQSIEPISVPVGIIPSELEQLVASFNDFQERINELVERERSFNRYASHELRTPLMVIKGAATLLGESSDPEFVEKQRQRLDRAANEMNAFIQTLLSLTKLPVSKNLITSKITGKEIELLVENHSYLLTGKNITTHVIIDNDLHIAMPEAAFNILIGNLIKNAFANTLEGDIRVTVTNQQLVISDTGIGLKEKSKHYEGYGLGLLLVNDICKQFECDFKLTDNDKGGCTAFIKFPVLP